MTRKVVYYSCGNDEHDGIHKEYREASRCEHARWMLGLDRWDWERTQTFDALTYRLRAHPDEWVDVVTMLDSIIHCPRPHLTRIPIR